MDPPSDVLSLLKPRTYNGGGLDIGADSSIQFQQHEGIKCYAVVSGQSWLSVEGVTDATCLKVGDCFLLPRGRAFRLASALAALKIDAQTSVATKQCGTFTSFDGGGQCVIVGGHFTFLGNQASMLLGVLPPIVHLHKKSDKAALRWSLERLTEELRDPQPGGVLVAQYLANMMLVQALRLHLTDGLRGGVGWLFALSNKQMSAAITSMHEEPAHDWTVEELAQRAGMSRSAFAMKFKETVGSSPIEYLTHWRMLLAGDRMATTSDSISEIAQSLGYESASAFTKAFKRSIGCSPRQYSFEQNPASPSIAKGKQPGARRRKPIAHQ